MSRIIALDIGDRWTGIAISDPLQMTARPHTTVATHELIAYLEKYLSQEPVECVIVGHPKTLKGTESEQTKKVTERFYALSAQFSQTQWKLWDERLSSKQASQFTSRKTQEDKLKGHAVAAALFLSSYLDHLALQKSW